ncbi:MAG: TonB-dependent receptor plug domain-containing protein, partial [Hyphomonadaceae bacterium]
MTRPSRTRRTNKTQITDFGAHTGQLLLGASLVALCTAYPAYAQENDDPNTAVEVTTTGDHNSDEERTEDTIFVTGSRLARGNFDTPSPVTTLDSELIEESGFVTLSDVLQRSPAIAVGQGIANAQTAGETAGATFANLRGLGSFRTLTLINGRRRVPGALSTSSVDLSSIPPSMVERVEIVTGGTSAVYGADAVTGVINVILKRDFEGLEFDFSAGIPEQGGGGDAQQASLHWGASLFDDRAKLNVGLSYYNSSVLQASDRDFSSGQNYMFFQTNVPGDSFNGSVPTFSVRRDPTTFLFAETGTFFFWNGSAYEYYTVDPELRMQQNDAPPFFNGFNGVAGNGWASGGDGFSFGKYGLLRGGFESYNMMSNFNFDISENTSFYVDAEIAVTETESPFQPNFHPASGDSIFLYRDNPLLTPGTTAFMDANGLSSLFVFRTQDDLGVRTTDVDRINYNLVAGLEGTLSNGWDFDVFAQHGKMDIETNTSNTLRRANYLNAIDVISDPVSGDPICRDPAAVVAGCTPLVVLGRNGPLTQAQRDYVLHTKSTDLIIDQTVLGGQVTGDLYSLPAGPIGAAVGFEYRDESISFRDDPLNQANELLLNAPTEDIDGSFDVA